MGLIPVWMLMDVEGTSAFSAALGTIVLSTTGAAGPFWLLPYYCCRFDLDLDFERVDLSGPLALAMAMAPRLTCGVSSWYHCCWVPWCRWCSTVGLPDRSRLTLPGNFDEEFGDHCVEVFQCDDVL